MNRNHFSELNIEMCDAYLAFSVQAMIVISFDQEALVSGELTAIQTHYWWVIQKAMCIPALIRTHFPLNKIINFSILAPALYHQLA